VVTYKQFNINSNAPNWLNIVVSGRQPETGTVYVVKYRYIPGLDPPELKVVLEAILTAAGQKRRDIIRPALLSGAGQAQQAASAVESTLIAGTVDDMFDAF
jgi:hypothetical protein